MASVARPGLGMQQLRSSLYGKQRWRDLRARAEPESAGDLDALRADLERFQRNKQAAAAASSTTAAAKASQPAPAVAASPNPLKEAVDKLLIADFFFIMLALAWLAAGLGEKAALHSETLIGAWMPLWPLVFQPAIGILMAGALVSGGIGWVQENMGKKQ